MGNPNDVRYAPTAARLRVVGAAEEADLKPLALIHDGIDREGNRAAIDDVATMKVYTVEEAAAALRVSTKTIRRRIKAGEIRPLPIGGRLVRISTGELRRILSGGETQADDDASIGYEVLGTM